jgi:hypothetical protein
MTTAQIKVGAGIAAAAIAGAAITAYFLAATPQPIIIGDSSVFVSHGNINLNSNGKELEAFKLGHKVKSITVTDLHNASFPPIVVPVENRKWTLKSQTGKITFDLKDHVLGKGVTGKCPNTQWQGTGTYVVCADDQLSPSTLTFTDGQNCPITGSTGPTCTLTCSTGYCRLDLEY